MKTDFKLETMSELNITDQRMIDFIDYCVDNEIEGIDSRSEFLRRIGLNPANMDRILKGDRGFTKDHLHTAGLLFNMSLDYAFGFSNEMFRSQKKRTSLQMLKEAVRAVEADLAGKKASNKKSNILSK